MAVLSREDVLKLARLAQLDLSDAEIKQFAKEMSAILAYVKQLDSIDTTGLTPTNQVTGLKNVTRPDTVIDYHITQKDLFKNVPSMQGPQIKVKRMIT